MKIRIEPYKTWSGGAKRLGLRAGILRATRKQVAKHGDFDLIINWGRTERRFNGNYINAPEKVGACSDKASSFQLFQNAEGVPTVPWTTDRAIAKDWFNNGEVIVVRKLLRASGGRGIQVIDPASDPKQTIPKAPLYTAYRKKRDEYRVHVFRGEAIDVQQKRKRNDVPRDRVDYRIRNHDRGFVFCRSELALPKAVNSAAINAVAALGLDFGAVDIGWNAKEKAPYVYEVNTAPGLEGSTLDAYYEAFLKELPSLRGGMYKKRRTKRGL